MRTAAGLTFCGRVPLSGSGSISALKAAMAVSVPHQCPSWCSPHLRWQIPLVQSTGKVILTRKSMNLNGSFKHSGLSPLSVDIWLSMRGIDLQSGLSLVPAFTPRTGADNLENLGCEGDWGREREGEAF